MSKYLDHITAILGLLAVSKPKAPPIRHNVGSHYPAPFGNGRSHQHNASQRERGNRRKAKRRHHAQ